MLAPEAVRDRLRRRWERMHRTWLDEAVAGQERGMGSVAGTSTDTRTWPVRIALGPITEREVIADPAAVRRWIDAWQHWHGIGTLTWTERRWRQLGDQRVPDALELASAAEVADWVEQSDRWLRARDRARTLVQRWPAVSMRLGRHFAALADEPPEDFERLQAALAWLLAHPASGLYLRELPIEGLDSKWLERHAALVRPMLATLMGRDGTEADGGLIAMAGLRTSPARVRMRVLCPALRAVVGGLCDVEAPLGDLAALSWRPRAVLIVENLASGLALPDLPGVVAFVGLGRAAVALAALPWLADADVVAWGDLDTHGLGIVALMRRVMPQLRSVLMDTPTLDRYRHLAVREPVQDSTVLQDWLTPSEMAALQVLRGTDGWGGGLRLEQERLPWGAVVKVLREAIAA